MTEAALSSALGAPEPPRTLGDELVIYVAARAGACAPPAEALLCRLAWPRAGTVDFAPLFRPDGQVLLDALQGDLAAAWAAAEADKATLASPALLAARGDAEETTLRGFLAAADAHRHLAGFVLDAAARIPGWHTGLDPDAPLGARRDARLRAAGLLRAVRIWRGWHDQHRALGFVDDGFAAAQPLLALWQRHAVASARALAQLTELESL